MPACSSALFSRNKKAYIGKRRKGDEDGLSEDYLPLPFGTNFEIIMTFRRED